MESLLEQARGEGCWTFEDAEIPEAQRAFMLDTPMFNTTYNVTKSFPSNLRDDEHDNILTMQNADGHSVSFSKLLMASSTIVPLGRVYGNLS